MRSLVIALAVVTAATPAVAEERFALAVNEPLFWGAKVIGVSAYVAVADRHVIRANVANYPAFGTQLTAVIAAPYGGSAGDRGGIFDAGAGWQWFPWRRWDGPTLEAGLLYRSDKTRQWDSSDQRTWAEIERNADAVVARGLLGWSWLIHQRLFITAAAGGALAYNRGTEIVRFDDEHCFTDCMKPQRATPLVGTFESYLRFGLTF